MKLKRLSVDIPEDVLLKIKLLAVKRNTTMRILITRWLYERILAEEKVDMMRKTKKG